MLCLILTGYMRPLDMCTSTALFDGSKLCNQVILFNEIKTCVYLSTISPAQRLRRSDVRPWRQIFPLWPSVLSPVVVPCHLLLMTSAPICFFLDKIQIVPTMTTNPPGLFLPLARTIPDQLFCKQAKLELLSPIKPYTFHLPPNKNTLLKLPHSQHFQIKADTLWLIFFRSGYSMKLLYVE